MPFVDYDPTQHQGLDLYEIQSSMVEEDNQILYGYAPATGISIELAAATPWYYVVWIDDVQAQAKKKGPGRGWWGPPKGTHTPDEGVAGRWDDARNGSGSPSDAAGWADGAYRDTLGSYSSDENHAIKDYTGHGYPDINDYARGKGIMKQSYSEFQAKKLAKAEGITGKEWTKQKDKRTEQYINSQLSNLDSAMSKSKTPDDMVTYRAISATGGTATRLRNLKPGDTFRDDGYTSATFDQKVAQDFGGYRMEVRVGAGQSALWTDGKSVNKGELEIILPRGSSFKVVKSGEFGMIVEVVGGD